MNKAITNIFRLFVGVLFIFSGLVKLNDPMGLSFKLHDYFAPDVLNIPFLIPLALPLATTLIIAEILLGLALLLGFKRKLSLGLLLAMIVFFTFLTFYSAYFDKVTDCGCFGDAIPLTPWQSFIKDLVLLVMLIWLWFYREHIHALFSKTTRHTILLLSLVLSIIGASYVLRHLPLIDFRAYAIGNNIREGMKSAEELGLQGPKFLTIYTLKNTDTGEQKSLDSDQYMQEKWWEKKEWEIQSDQTKTKQVSDGYEPKVKDFVITLQDEDITEYILDSDRVILVIAYNLEKTNTKLHKRVNDFVVDAEKHGVSSYGITATSSQRTEEIRHELQTPYPFASADETMLKTVIRANPGVVVLDNGTIVAKWNPRDLPTYSEFIQRNVQ